MSLRKVSGKRVRLSDGTEVLYSGYTDAEGRPHGFGESKEIEKDGAQAETVYMGEHRDGLRHGRGMLTCSVCLPLFFV
jgi:hypothetical protein